MQRLLCDGAVVGGSAYRAGVQRAAGVRAAPRRLTLLAAGAAATATVLVTVLPFLRFAYEAPALHSVLETANGVIALLVGYLVYGRYRLRGTARDLLLALALAVLAVANAVLTAVPAALAVESGPSTSGWASIAVRLLGTLLVGASACVAPDRVVSGRTARRLLGGVLAVAALAMAVPLLLDDRLPLPLDPAERVGDGSGPLLAGHPLVLAAQVVGLVVYAFACVVFTRQATGAGRGDELLRHLGAGCALAAGARVNYLLFPSLYSDFVYTGDVLRFAFYALLLRGATREIRTYWESLSYTAVLEDRRRLARDLHDGLTQELTYIWSQSRLLPAGDPVADRINGAAARALDEARTAIAALTRTTTGSFAEVLRQSVDGLSGRYGAAGDVTVDGRVEPTPEQADAVLRIVAEAFRNATRHGAAGRVSVEVTAPPLVVLIRDDGTGFSRSAPVTSPAGGGFGLTSMRERAEGLGATFDLRSQVGAGTTVEVRWTT